MKPLTHEWADKAEGDWHDALRAYRARIYPNYDSTCFHAQQCVEKYLKAQLDEVGIAFSKTHNLQILLTLLVALEPTWDALLPQAIALNSYAIDFRYPGKSATRVEAKLAIENCRQARLVIRTALGLPV